MRLPLRVLAHPLRPHSPHAPPFRPALPPILDSFCPQRHYSGVADIYEDRLRLFAVTAGGRGLEVSTGAIAVGEAWRRPAQEGVGQGGVSVTSSPSPSSDEARMYAPLPCCAPLVQARSAPMKRTPELGQLRGLRYAGKLALTGWAWLVGGEMGCWGYLLAH